MKCKTACHPERTREGSGLDNPGQILRGVPLRMTVVGILMLVKSSTILRAIEPTTAPVVTEHLRIVTAHTQVALFVGSDERLYQLAYGAIDKKTPDPKKLTRAEEFHPPAGNGYIAEPAIQAFHADGNTSTD